MAGNKIRYEDYVDDLYDDVNEETEGYSRTKERRDVREMYKDIDMKRLKKVKKIRNSEFS